MSSQLGSQYRNFQEVPKEPPLDVLNDSGLRTGEVLPREQIHRLGRIHRAVHLFLFDPNGALLLQKRSPNVDHYPNKYSISLTGHVDSGESSTDALERELKEELDLEVKNLSWLSYLFSFRRDAILSETYIDKQFNDVFAAQGQFDIRTMKVEKASISGLQLVPFSQFEQMVKDKDGELAPVYAEECKDVAHFVRKKLFASKL